MYIILLKPIYKKILSKVLTTYKVIISNRYYLNCHHTIVSQCDITINKIHGGTF